MDSTAFLVIAILAIAAQAFMLFLALFEPGLKYKVTNAPEAELDSDEFTRTLEVLCDAKVHPDTEVEVLTNGEAYYEAELDAIRQANDSIHLEFYIFQKGRVAKRFIEVLTERARAGVNVKMVLDAIGSFPTWSSNFRELEEAGGKVAWYHPLSWHTWPRLNNRTHRELIIIDGEVGFIGGAGVADHWLHGRKSHPPWRDSMFKIRGGAVSSLQATFAENWLEASGELFTGKTCFPLSNGSGQSRSLVVNSSPSAGRSTRARILFQLLLASAQKSLRVTTPYFLPDNSARAEMIRALTERGVDVKIIVPGRKSDHLLTRRSSRRIYGCLLEAGARIFEYERSMIHTKTLIVDRIWSVVGSTNFDNRSFGINDEVNLAIEDPKVAERLEQDFVTDLAQCREITLADWKRRPIFERAHEYLGWLLERQQ